MQDRVSPNDCKPELGSKLRVVIADDEPLARESLWRFLRAEPNIEVVAECVNGSEAVKAIREKLPDLVFLDVKMPELDGFGVLEAINGDHLPAIILVTAHDQYAVRAFEANAVDYLLKPFNRERFQAALRRARARPARESVAQNNQLLTEVLASLETKAARLERVTVKSNGRIYILKTAEIDWIRAADNYAELHTGKIVHLVRMTIGALADKLPNQFVRISRSLLVNLNRIKEIRPKSHGDCWVVLENGPRLTASRSYRKDLVERLGNS